MSEYDIRERDATYRGEIPKHWQAQLDRRTLLRLLDEARTLPPPGIVQAPLQDVEAVIDWWRHATEAPGGCSPGEAIQKMQPHIMNIEYARRKQYERACSGCNRTMSINRPCPFCGTTTAVTYE